MKDFDKPPQALEDYMKEFYEEMFISGSDWGMRQQQQKYESVEKRGKELAAKLETTVAAGAQLWESAWKCSPLRCKPKNPNIVYYGEHVEKLKLWLRLDVGCLKKNFACKADGMFGFEKAQTKKEQR